MIELGCVLFEMLTGRRPYEGESVTAVAMAHVQQQIPSVREIDDRLPASLDGVLAKAMAKDPRERYQSAGELADDALAAVEGRLRNTGSTVAFSPSAPPDDEATLVISEGSGAPDESTPISPPEDETATTDAISVSRRQSAGILLGRVAALAGCLVVVGLAYLAHSYVNYGQTGYVSLYRSAHGYPSPVTGFEFGAYIALVVVTFVLIGLSFVVFRRFLAVVAMLVALLVLGQTVRFWLGYNTLRDGTATSHTVGVGYWLSLGAAIVVGLGAALAASEALAPSSVADRDR